MSKIRKILISIIIGIIAVFGIYSVSNAYYVGQTVNVTYNQYASSSNIFCVEHGQALTTDNRYKVISNVKIKGTTSTDHKEKTIENKSNAKFAYILSANNGASHDSGPVQNEIWNYGYTWMKNVGRYHNGLNLSFISAVSGSHTSSTTKLDAEATNYANNISKGTKVTDNTNKSKIKVEAYSKDGKQYMRVGPFNWTFGGKLTEVSIYDQNSKSISGKLYSTFNGKTEKWINPQEIKSGSNFYISIPANSGATKITKVTGKMDVEVKTVNIWFLRSTTDYKQNLIIREPDSEPDTIDLSFDYKISILGNLQVIKVDKNNKKIKLPNVGFKIQNKDTKKWVKQDKNGNISYVDSKKEAKEFKTDNNGKITIKNLIVGTYVAYETKNPNYGYEIIKDGKEKKVTVDKTAELKIPNEQKYIKLSGYVWVDRYFGKQSTRNDLYKDKDDIYDKNDILLDGITVRLKDTSGNVIKTAKTANGGAYQFKDVLIKDLDKYYVEFEYDGLTYTNVVLHKDKDNGSKAKEGTARTTFDNKFAEITANTEIDGKKLKYNSENYTSTLINSGKFIITSTTKEAQFDISKRYKAGMTEIKNINLGLYEREQPDNALVKDIENVRFSVNGYQHVYKYANRFANMDVNEDKFNVGVKFGNKYGNKTYTRPIYKSDYDYKHSNENNELKVYVTYKITIKNESTNLTSKINSLLDYYDAKYTLEAAGTEVGEDGNIKGTAIAYKEVNYNNDYNKSILETNVEIEHGQEKNIYVQFSMNKETVGSIMFDANGQEVTDKLLLDNVVEINSYSTYKDNKLYAGIDKDSKPGNTVPGDRNTYEDDTDAAPALQLVVANARKITGTVFLDETKPELKTGEKRLGDGEYKEGVETTISGVVVKMLKEDGTEVAGATTDEKGNFELAGFIPGNYTIVYTWGNETYTVKDYKGTIYNDPSRRDNTKWYQKTTPRYSDAIDNYDTRKNIDSGAEITTMDSTTPTMNFGIEMFDNNAEGTIDITPGIDKVEFEIPNVDFGIVERARQQIDINKRVSGFKVTLANGQVVADVKIDENGNTTGEKDHVTCLGPSSAYINGSVKLELDNELIQGATLQVEYEIAVKNNSELDYDTEDFYLYGTPGKDEDKICIKPEGVYDYLDSEMALDTTKDTSKWAIVSNEENEEAEGLANKTILQNKEELEKQIAPGESNRANLYASKVLTNNDEIELNNDAKITKVTHTRGTGETSKTGRQITPETSKFEDGGETVIVTTPTGQDQNYIAIIATTISALVILGAGVIVIRKKILGSK